MHLENLHNLLKYTIPLLIALATLNWK